MVRIGFLGAGKMAQALAKGFVKAGLVKSDRIIASCIPQDESSAEAFKNLGSKVTFTNAEVAEYADVVVLAVKPNIALAVLNEVNNNKYVTENNLFISIAMGITLQTLQNNLPEKSKIVRVMPNTPALVQQGVSIFVPGDYVSEKDISLITTLFKSLGTCDRVPEQLLDAVTALSGAGPAYIYVIIEAMADGAVRMGLPRDLAYKLAAQTVIGAGEMVIKTGNHPGKLKDDVTSPGGSTADALLELETSGVRAAMIRAIGMATKKCKEVSTIIK